MRTVINKPKAIKAKHLTQIINLIKTGGEIKTSDEDLKKNLLNAELIAYKLDGDKVISTATLKNPFLSYKTKIFNLAKVSEKEKFHKELGYIATDPNYEGKGYCSNLLKDFFSRIDSYSIYATTRKPAMKHILGKFNFKQVGISYKKDLNLLTYKAKK